MMTVLQNLYAALTALIFVWLIAAFPYEQKNVPQYKPFYSLELWQPFSPRRDTKRLIYIYIYISDKKIAYHAHILSQKCFKLQDYYKGPYCMKRR
jgi:hypothetical protein